MNLNKIFDTIQDFQKVNENNYNYLKNGQPTYQLTKADKHWQCTCPAYKFHHTCKHSEELEQLLKVTTDPDPHHQRHPRAEMEKFIPELTEICKPLDTWEIVGSWRRKSPTFKDVDVIALATPEAWKQVRENLKASGAWQEDIFGDTLMRGIYHGYYLDFNLCPDQEHWLWWLIYRTGSSDENVALRRRAISMGYGISENGIQDRFSFDYYPNEQVHTEEDFYHFFGYEYRPPEQRDGKNFKELPNFNIEEHYSDGLKQKIAGDVDWTDYLLESMKKVKGNVYSSAKYPLRKAILVAKEIARRWDRPVEEILRVVDPLAIQPEGPKKGQQTWDKDGNIIKATEDYNQLSM